MTTITLSIPDVHSVRVVDALCQAGGLPPSEANAKLALINHIRQTVKNIERTQADRSAAERVAKPVNIDVT